MSPGDVLQRPPDDLHGVDRLSLADHRLAHHGVHGNRGLFQRLQHPDAVVCGLPGGGIAFPVPVSKLFFFTEATDQGIESFVGDFPSEELSRLIRSRVLRDSVSSGAERESKGNSHSHVLVALGLVYRQQHTGAGKRARMRTDAVDI